MALSPSDIFNAALSGKSIAIENYLSVRPHQNTNRVRVIYTIHQNKPYFKSRSIIVGNPLAMMQAIGILRTELHALLAQETMEMLQREQEKATQQFLAGQRLRILQKHRERIAEEERRVNTVVQHVRKPIQAILQRVAPVNDPWAYRNVYGKPAEVFIF